MRKLRVSKFLTAVISVLVISAMLCTNVAALDLTEITIDKLVTTPTIDGVYNADEGWGKPVASISFADSETYLSSADYVGDKTLIPNQTTVYVRWDDKNLYFCAVIQDDTHFNETTTDNPSGAYAGDALQVDIKSDADDDDTSERARFFYGVNNSGELVAGQDKVESTIDYDISSYVPAWTACVVKRDEASKTTTYETAFDWARNVPSTKKIAEGSQILFRVIVLCTKDADTPDIVDLNVPGANYAYWKVTLGGQNAEELAASLPVETAAETTAAAAAAAADTAAPAAAATTAAQTGDAVSIAVLAVVAIAAGAYCVIRHRR